MEQAGRFLAYRRAVLLLALGYWLYQFRHLGEAGFGWQFRYLTIWALTASLLSAFAVLRHARGRGTRPDTLASVAAVLNALVVLLYWRLYLIDPALVNGANGIVWWQEYYLHLAGPVLQWIDALLLMGAFRAPLRVLGVLAVLVLAYVGWIELAVAPLNATPVGDATSGLPYPFLNDLDLADRLRFYLSTSAMAVLFTGLGWGICLARRMVLRRRLAAAE
ncbi:hypothetical protein [Oceaniglobus roseus]|uniref:hypothetical protein n=1 Tax=Oceaniglobus roseus TaxID=1737570 RepID=UPI0012FFFECD|nr:hypothetical protein [Kandeliimicrobium roseum]